MCRDLCLTLTVRVLGYASAAEARKRTATAAAAAATTRARVTDEAVLMIAAYLHNSNTVTWQAGLTVGRGLRCTGFSFRGSIRRRNDAPATPTALFIAAHDVRRGGGGGGGGTRAGGGGGAHSFVVSEWGRSLGPLLAATRGSEQVVVVVRALPRASPFASQLAPP